MRTSRVLAVLVVGAVATEGQRAVPGLSGSHRDIIKEGTLEATVNGQAHRVGPGAVLFMASNQLHTVRNVGEAPAVYDVINWKSPGTPKEPTSR